jgi:hypothetical protein
MKLSIINEGVNSTVTLSSVKISSKTVASVGAPKTEEHIIGESISNGRGRWLENIHENRKEMEIRSVWEVITWMSVYGLKIYKEV